LLVSGTVGRDSARQRRDTGLWLVCWETWGLDAGVELDAMVAELRGQGLSVRRIAARLGVGKNVVQRSIERVRRAESEAGADPWVLAEDEAELLASLDADDPEPVPPLRYTGMAAGVEDGRVRHDPIIEDAAGQKVDPMALRRYKCALGERGEHAAETRLTREIRAAIHSDGWRMVRLGDRIDYRRVEEIRRDGLEPATPGWLDGPLSST
jgi:transposase